MRNVDRRRLSFHALSLLAIIAALAGPVQPPPALASHTPEPSSVTVAGSLQSEAGCSGDWQADCALTHLTFDANDDVWQGVWTLPAGSYEYKAPLNDSWTENYGQHGVQDGPNIPLTLGAGAAVKFYYDHKSHWVTDNQTSVIAVAPGSFQSELGCTGDWDPGCLRSWLQDVDGDGTYTFETAALPAGNYEAKVAINESWDENYGQGGALNGPNIPFTVPVSNARVTFSYHALSHLLTVTSAQSDNNIEWDGLRHDSRDSLYRTPGGAVTPGTPVVLRFRTFHDDATAVTLRAYDLNANAQRLVPMTRVAVDEDCYQPGLSRTCDYWAATLTSDGPNNFWYRFIVADGSDTDYYGDNTSALDGGLGAVSDEAVDQSFALMVYDPAFAAPDWARDAVIYQIFPDRFRNGDRRNDPDTGDARYDDPVVALPWGVLPEGYCRNYADGDVNCPWRFDATPPDWSPAKEGPRGRDYYGGDLKGVISKLAYLDQLGVTAIYFNPIFFARSNHRYDTSGYYQIDPALGTLQDFHKLVKEARKHGIRIILDGVFNHMSSDSPTFDRYHHFSAVGACESAASQWRSWFVFRPPAGSEPSPCAPSAAGGSDTYYDGWFGFDSIPVLAKSNPLVQDYFVTGNNSVSRYWLDQGAAGWRLDVMGDASFPNGYWEAFRDVVKDEDPDALIIGELWQKDSTLLRFLRGDRADTTMNYRLRDAVIGFLAPGSFDSKGFGDSGRIISPSEFGARILSVQEDYPDAAYNTLMNLLDSHDTERLLWTLTPGVETTAGKELDPANLEAGKLNQKLASLIQYTMPGAPTIYYGDEVGLTGDDDPDDRRTYPWSDRGGRPDHRLLFHYQLLALVRRAVDPLTQGDLRMLLADDSLGTIAYGRKTTQQAALVVVNRSDQSQTVTLPVAGYLPDGTTLIALYGVHTTLGGRVSVAGGVVTVTLPARSGLLLVTGKVDLKPPPAPSGLQVTGEGNGSAGLSWNRVNGAAAYNVYRSPVTGGGWVKVNPSPVAGTSFADSGLRNARAYYYIVRAVDSRGNESADSNEVSALPHVSIGWANLQWPPSITHTLNVLDRTDNIYGQVWIDGVTGQPGPAEGLLAQAGFGPDGSSPRGNPDWAWVDAAFNVDAGNNDEFVASLLPEAVGAYDYVYRYSTTGGRDWLYADLNGPVPEGASPPNPGALTVNASGDTTAPAVPSNLRVNSASPAGIDLSWDAVGGDPSLYGYDVRRSDTAGGPYTTLALITGTNYVDTAVAEGATYYYVVRAVDTSFNRSAHSAEAAATAQLRTVTLVLTVTVPAATDGTGRPVYIAGSLNRLEGGLPEWNPGGVVLTRLDATHWRVTLTGRESTQIEYKYTLGDWEHVEKEGACGEIANRMLTLTYGASGTQAVDDTVLNWRNVAPCGN
jgi:glycosidase